MRRRPYIDTRPDWRDPNMPVLLQTTHGLVQVSAESAQYTFAVRVKRLEQMEDTHPFINWRNDPTYNMRRKK